MGDNGIVKENAQHNIDRDKYSEGLDRIFGKREELNKFREEDSQGDKECLKKQE